MDIIYALQIYNKNTTFALYAAECLLNCLQDPYLNVEYEKNERGENTTPLKIVNLSCNYGCDL